jgi:hypothetical protein
MKMWLSKIIRWGEYHCGIIEEIDRTEDSKTGELLESDELTGKRIGYHFQWRNCVFFILGPDITVREAEKYENSLKECGFEFIIVPNLDTFRLFVSESKDLDSIFRAAVEVLLPKGIENANISSIS